tara:strand:+ start:1096 stop:2391 length:1296 start_codon:yes stop_codon:yes gene_type:complete
MAVTEKIVINYAPRKLQLEIHNSEKRFVVVCAHRRFGKTVMAINELVKRALSSKKERFRGHYIAPFYRMAKLISWDYCMEFCKNIPGVLFNQSELRVDFPNGARIQLAGSEAGGGDGGKLRGQYSDFAVLDEVAMMPPNFWTMVVRPMLADRKGGAWFISTPQGHNAFYDLFRYATEQEDPEWLGVRFKASETNIIDKDELKAAQRLMSRDAFQQEFETSFSAAIVGAYYADELQQMADDDRICSVPYEAAVPVHTAWDLGVSDATAIVCFQLVGREVRIIDYYESSGVGLQHYFKWLKDQPYVWGEHILPHDIKVRELGSGRTRLETLQSFGIHPTILPNESVEDGINAVRGILSRVYIDQKKCDRLIQALRQYRAEYDQRLGTLKSKPFHGWESHAADAVRYMAMGLPAGGSFGTDWGSKPNIDNSWIV